MNQTITFKEFVGELQKYPLAVIGELHGTKEIPKIVKRIIQAIQPEVIYFELPETCQGQEQSFFSNNQDGRGSEEYFYLIEHLSQEGKPIKFIEPSEAEDKDKGMFSNLVNDFRKRSLVVCGNMHGISARNPFTHQKTFGYYVKQKIKQDVVSVNILPVKGTYYNNGIKDVIKKTRLPGIYPHLEQGYDYTYLIKQASPCSFIT